MQSANRAFYDAFQVDRAETEGRLIYELGNGQWDIPRLRELLSKVLPQDETVEAVRGRAHLRKHRREDHAGQRTQRCGVPAIARP